MFTEIEAARDALKAWLAELDVACIDGAQAAHLTQVLAEIERITVAAKTFTTARVDETEIWKNSGAKSAAEWLAGVSGSKLDTAIQTVEVARAIDQLPSTEQTLRSGTLSLAQASEVTKAAAHDPSAESRLLEAASKGLPDVRREAKRVRSQARSNEEEAARVARQRALRSMYFWDDDDGMVCGRFRLEPGPGMKFRKLVEASANRAFETARRKGERHTTEQYAADALTQLVLSNGSGPSTASEPTAETEPSNSAETTAPSVPTLPEATTASVQAQVLVVVDFAPLLRGHVRDGERCEIPGVGPVPVQVARDYLLGGAFLKVLIARGVDIRTVCHYGRHVPAELRTAIEYRDPCCVAVGCNRHEGLERHHVEAVAVQGETSLFNLRRVCTHHHDLITHRGYALGPPDADGKCELLPP